MTYVAPTWDAQNRILTTDQMTDLAQAAAAAAGDSDAGVTALLENTSSTTYAAVQSIAAASGGASDATVAPIVEDSSSATYAAVEGVVDAHLGGDATGLVTAVASNTQETTALKQVGKTLVGTNTAATDVTALNSTLTAAATLGVPVILRGDFAVNSLIDIPAGARVAGNGATITQTANLTNTLHINNASNVRISGLRIVGVTSDYVNSSTVYNAVGIYIGGTSSDVTVTDCTITGVAGVGVWIDTGTTNVHVARCTITGPGSTYIKGTTYNFSSGIRCIGSGWSAEFNDISGYAQGINTGDGQANYRIIGNRIHDIPGQHGLYLEQATRGIIQGNIIWNTGLLGMKIQIGSTSSPDATDCIISGNVFQNVGDAGILLTNPGGSTPNLRRILVVNNVVDGSGADGITVNTTINATIAGNNLTNCGRNGISITSCSAIDIRDNRVMTCQWNGIALVSTADSITAGNRVVNPCQAGNATNNFGLLVDSGCSEIRVTNNKVTDSASHMRYGMYIRGTADLTTTEFIENVVSGATDYGYRGLAANARAFWGNSFAGGLGSLLTPPSNFPALTSTSTTAQIVAALQAAGLSQ